jgi:NADH-quinone oxidoreductase subunit B
MFNNYALVQGVDQVVPVDVYTPGCPPGPETLIHSILTLHEQIRRGEITRRRAVTGAGAGLHLEEARALQLSSASASRAGRGGQAVSG